MRVQPYLFFEGRCEEALQFYQEALGAEVTMLLRYKDGPEQMKPGTLPSGSENKVMHANFRVGETTILASDGLCSGQRSFQGFSLTIIAGDDAEAERLFQALGNGGQIRMPLSQTFFSPKFGMVVDRFGVSWMVIVQA